MAKILTILIPTMKIHSSMGLVFPKLKTVSKEFVVGTKEQKVLPHINMSDRILIRWGSPYETMNIAGSVDYNSRQSARWAANKRYSRKILSNAGVSVPRVVTPKSEDITYPLIARPGFHSLGKNLIIIENRKDFVLHYKKHASQNWYYSEYVDKSQEFRVNVAHGKILSILEVPKGEHRFSWNRTQTNIPPVLLEPDQWNLAVVKESIRAVKTLGMDYAGVDVMLDREGRAYILELNTTPGMSSTVYTQEKYAQYFDWLAVSDTRRPHFEVESEDPRGYAWGEGGGNGYVDNNVDNMLLTSSCSVAVRADKKPVDKPLQKELQSVLSGDLDQAMVGISIYHEQQQRFLYEQNEYTQLVPASATKLLTAYAALKYLPDRLPGWYVYETPDTLYIKPNADGTFLHRKFKEQRFYEKLLSSNKPIVLNMPPVSAFNPLGYRWPKNSYRFAQERSVMPIYGNAVRCYHDGNHLRTEPLYFDRYLPKDLQVNAGIHYSITRENPHNNDFSVTPARNNRPTMLLPFTRAEDQYVAYRLLKDTLKGKTLVLNTELLALPYQRFYTYKTEDVLGPMMHNSDNFLAEQLLLMVSSEVLDHQISDHLAINKVVQDNFGEFYDRPAWVDGSGLSRSNKMSPRFFISLLQTMKEEFSAERLRIILPQGNEGTLKGYYLGNEKRIYAKTGGLKSDVVSLSGYLDTKKGNSVVFSFMVNNHQGTRMGAHKAIEQVLTCIIGHY